MPNHNDSVDNTNAQVLLNQIVVDYMREKKRKRTWQWIKRFIILLLIIWLGYLFTTMRAGDIGARATPHVGLIDVKGTIAEDQAASADNLMKGMDKAYESKSLKALILRIDSPGGSPVQADYMFNAIRYYRTKHPDVKIYAVCVDACASAAYYIAAATDEIYANPASLVGSIGVLYNGFGFVDTLQKVGVSRRLQTAGSNKGFLDPFSPLQAHQQELLQNMLDIIHQQFIARVKEGRGARLKVDADTFSGLYWTGEQAKERGLIDGFASSGQLMREVIKLDQVVDYTYQTNLFERMAKTMGTAMADQLPSAMGMRSGIKL